MRYRNLKHYQENEDPWLKSFCLIDTCAPTIREFWIGDPVPFPLRNASVRSANRSKADSKHKVVLGVVQKTGARFSLHGYLPMLSDDFKSNPDSIGPFIGRIQRCYGVRFRRVLASLCACTRHTCAPWSHIPQGRHRRLYHRLDSLARRFSRSFSHFYRVSPPLRARASSVPVVLLLKQRLH